MSSTELSPIELSPQIFLPLDPPKYQWRRSYKSSGWERPALAGERMWIHRPKEYLQMFLSGSLSLESPVTRSAFHSAAKGSWLRLRYETPEIAVSAKCADDGKVYMQAHVPQDDAEAARWCEETLFLEHGRRKLEFGELREKILLGKAGQDSNPTSILLYAIINDDGDVVKDVDFILNGEHQITDGIGIRIMLSKYLSVLATNILKPTNPRETRVNWEKSFKFLTPPWICFMDEKQVLSGPEYEKAVVWNQQVLLRKMPENLGLPLLRTVEPVIQNSHFITFTQTKSKMLLGTIKAVIGPEANITHLGHAAMVLALLRNTPLPASHHPSSDYLVIYSPCWLNGRRYIRCFDAQLSPKKSYIPICQSFAPVIFSDLHDLVLSPSATKVEVKDKLIEACKIAEEQYSIIKQRKSMMPESVALIEYLGDLMYQQAQPTIPTRDKAQPLTAHPFFLSDGITENYINREYYQTHDPDFFDGPPSSFLERKAFEVDDIKFAAHAEGPNLIVRMSSWRDRVTVSGEWRGCDYEMQMAVGFLEDIVGIILSILPED